MNAMDVMGERRMEQSQRKGRAARTVIKSIVSVFVLAVAVVVGGAYIIPPVARVERAVLIGAPPPAVYAIVSDLQRFPEWSPWEALDPAVRYDFGGPGQGIGQKMIWSSRNPQVGTGVQTVTALEPDRKVEMEIEVGALGKARSEIVLSPVEEGTAVIWRFEKPVEGVIERWASLMFDRAIGADYVRGLARLKALAETPAAGG